jgi:heterodisulfide reductase subunit C
MLTGHDSSKMMNKKHNRKKKGILGELDNVQPKPSKNLMKHKKIIKECVGDMLRSRRS